MALWVGFPQKKLCCEWFCCVAAVDGDSLLLKRSSAASGSVLLLETEIILQRRFPRLRASSAIADTLCIRGLPVNSLLLKRSSAASGSVLLWMRFPWQPKEPRIGSLPLFSREALLRVAPWMGFPQEKLCCEWLRVAAVDGDPLATERFPRLHGSTIVDTLPPARKLSPPQEKLCCEWLRVAAVDLGNRNMPSLGCMRPLRFSPPQEKLCCEWLRFAAGNRKHAAVGTLCLATNSLLLKRSSAASGSVLLGCMGCTEAMPCKVASIVETLRARQTLSSSKEALLRLALCDCCGAAVEAALVPSLHECGVCEGLGRSPAKNCKNDLDDQT